VAQAAASVQPFLEAVRGHDVTEPQVGVSKRRENVPTADKTSRMQPADRVVRAAGLLYLLFVVTSVPYIFVPQTLIVSGDAAATAHRVLASEMLFRTALVSGLIATIIFVFLARELYRLLSSVHRSWALLMVVLVLLSVPISFVAILAQIAALTLIHGGPALSGLDTSQMNALAMFFLGLSSDTSSLNSIFFGLWLFPFGLLVIRSRFVPRILGYLLIIASVSYLVGTLNFVLSPPFAKGVSAVVSVGYLGELGVVVWLVVAAARVQLGHPLNLKPLETEA
jgi:hypothetical protein